MLIVVGILTAALASLAFSTLTYALRDFSRARLEHRLAQAGKLNWFAPTVARLDELIYLTAALRLLANILVVIGCLRLVELWQLGPALRYTLTALLAALVSLFFSVSIPTALARHAGEAILAAVVVPLHALRAAMLPLSRLLEKVDAMVRRAVGPPPEAEPDLLERDLLSVVEEGEKEGVVDTTERRMIESVIEFRDTEAGQIMTSRPEIVALEVTATLDVVKRTLEESGHSRVPVYDGTLDHIVGVLYARDLLRQVGQPADRFDVRAVIRPALFVPETKLLRDLLKEFRAQKVHMAIVLDEYGGTAGLITIEDILEELVGDISDEHEPTAPAMLRKLDPRTFDVDARIYVGDLNRRLGTHLPEDAGYDTLGGFVTTTLGRIPQKGATFEHEGVRYTVTEAEPQRVARLKVELVAAAPAPAAGVGGAAATAAAAAAVATVPSGDAPSGAAVRSS